ncbi:MAG: class I SAM-dependent methyltransferase [Nocardioidaceae bacterium]
MAEDDGIFCEYAEIFRTVRHGEPASAPPLDVLAAVDLPAGEPLLDVGAGTGAGTLALAARFPDREVLAVEPSRIARTVMLTRLGERGLTEERVTVYSHELGTADLPQVAGGIAIHVLCQLPAGGIPRFLERLDWLLLDGGALLVDGCFGPTEATQSEPTLDLEHTIGRHTYRRWSSTEPHDDQTVLVRHTFRRFLNDVQDAEETVESLVAVNPPDQVHAMFAHAGFRAEPAGDRYLVLRRA